MVKSLFQQLPRAIGAALFCLVITGAQAFGQAAKLQLPNLEHLHGKAKEVVDVSLDAGLLKLAGRVLSTERSGDEAKVRELIQGLQGVYVKVFEFDKEGQYSKADVELVRAQIKAPGWSRIVGVVSSKDGDNVDVYAMTEGGQITGLAIISAEPKELTIVNIVGTIDLEKLGELGGKFGIPKLGKTKKPKKE